MMGDEMTPRQRQQKEQKLEQTLRTVQDHLNMATTMALDAVSDARYLDDDRQEDIEQLFDSLSRCSEDTSNIRTTDDGGGGCE